MANARGGRVIIGVEDAGSLIANNPIKFMRSDSRPFQNGGKAYACLEKHPCVICRS